MRLPFLALVAITPPVVAAHGQCAPPAATSRASLPFASVVDRVVPPLLDALDVPGAAVALVHDGRVEWMRGYGFADVDARRPVTPQTVFNTGSISKVVTAWAVLTLAQDRRIDLDRPVDLYLKRWHVPASRFDARGVTARRLLSHTAGVSAPVADTYGPRDTVPPIAAALSGVRLVRAPGSAFEYSAGGYGILQLLVEDVSGEPFQSYVAQHVLAPLGMMHSAFQWTAPLLAHAATPYDGFDDALPYARFSNVAAAGFETTVADLARLAAAELTPPSGASAAHCLTDTALARLTQRTIAPAPHWGVGHEVLHDTVTGLTFVGHNGSNRGWISIYQISPQTGDGIVVLTNGSNGFRLASLLTCAWERSIDPRARTRYCDKPDARSEMYARYRASGVRAAIARFDAIRAHGADMYTLDATQLVLFGYDLLHAGHLADATRTFEAATARYPDDWNAHDSLGEAYLAAHDTTRAVREYRRSLQLNSANTNATSVLQRIAAAH